MTLKLLSYSSDDPDIAQLISWIPSQKALRQWAGPSVLTWPLDKQQLFSYLGRAEGKEPEAHIFKTMNENGDYLGHIEFDKVDRINKTTVLSRVLIGPKFRGAGLGNQMIKTGLEFIFNELKFTEVKLTVYCFNKPAIRCYEKIGFKIIGNIEQDRLNSVDQNWDCHIMSISKR